MATTSILPLTLGSAVLARTFEPDGPPPEFFRDGYGQCWRLVTDPKIIEAAQDAKDYADAQDQENLDLAAQAAQEKAEAAQAEAIRLAGIAATEADEALEAALGDLVSDKSNVFIQDVPPVAEMRKPGVLWIDTTPAMVDGAQVPGNIPKTWGGTAWVAITDSAVVQAAAEAAAAHAAADVAADAAADAMAEARYAPRIADRPPGQADGVNKPDGAGWLEYDPATQLLKQMWRWTGATWERLPMDPVMIPVIQIGTGTAGDLTADRVVVTGEFVARVAQILELDVANLVVTEGATINDLVAVAIAGATAEFQEAYIQNLRTNGAVIDEAVIGDIAANLITSGMFRTAANGQRVVIDQTGIVMYGLDEGDIEYEMVRIGPAGDNLITAGDTTISPAGVQAPSGEFDELAVAGEDLGTIFDRLPKGVVARGTVLETIGRSVTNGEVELGELRVSVEPWRSYRLTIEPVSVYATALSYAQLRIHWTQGGANGAPPPMLSSEIVRYITSRRTGSTGRDEMIQLGGAFSIQSSESEELRFLFGLYSDGTASIFDSLNGGAFRAIMEDIGPSTTDIMTNRTGSDSNPKPPPPVKKTYKKTYTANGYRTYNADGSSAGTPDVVQGLYAGGPSRFRRRGGWTFPSMTGDLSGATIDRIEAYVYCDHTYASAGSTVNLCVWGGAMRDNLSIVKTFTMKRNTGRWVDLPAHVFGDFRSGNYSGIGVISTSSSANQYARFRPTGARLMITYTK